MKQHIITALLVAALAPCARSEKAPATQMRDSATHEQLSMTYRQVALQDPMRNLQPATGVDPTLVNQPKDLVADSDIICFGGNATLVPKRAIRWPVMKEGAYIAITWAETTSAALPVVKPQPTTAKGVDVMIRFISA